MKKHDRATSGFTLLELLVVIAIIALLSGILFGVFAQAREKARQTTCVNNLRQLGAAFLLYAQDNDEGIPAFCRFSGKDMVAVNAQGVALSWDIALLPYFKTGEILRCPSDIHSKPISIPGLGKETVRSYNIALNVQGKRFSQISAAAQTVILLEAFSGRTDDLRPQGWGGDSGLWVLNKLVLNPEWPVVTEIPEFRHNDSGNYLFADCHVKALPGPKPAFPGYRTSSDGVARCSVTDPLPQ